MDVAEFETVTRVEKGRDIPSWAHPYCNQCIENARQKYNNFMAENNVFYEDGFGVNCPFINKGESFWPEKLKLQMTPEEWKRINVPRSALLWGEANLKDPDNGKPWRAWLYQRAPLLCQSPRKVYRFGRRCMPAGTPILMADGSWKRIEMIKPGEYVISRNKKAQFIKKRVVNFWENGKKNIYRITLSNGMWVDCTSNHPLLTYVLSDKINKRGIVKKWMSIEDGLRKGMKVCILGQFDKWGSESHEDLGILLGYLLTDGYIEKKQTPKFTNNNLRMIEEVKSVSDRLFKYDCSIYPKGNGWDIYITDKNKGTSNKLVEELKRLKLLGLKASNKILPSWIYSWDKKSVMLLINRMFSGDGALSCYKKKGRPKEQRAVEINLSSTSRELLDQTRLILLKTGVVGHINKDHKIKKEEKHKQLWKLRISSKESILNFLENVGFIYGKEDKCKEIIDALSNRKRKSRGIYKHQKFVAIRSIEEIGVKSTYDIEVDNTHNFVGNGVCVHNTGKTSILAVEILWYLWTSCGGTLKDVTTGNVRRNLKVLLLAPQKSHIENIFGRIRAFIATNPIIESCVDRNKRGSPQVISFKTSDSSVGNMVSGFASGDQSGSKGLSARGEDADLVVLDEGAFVSEEVITNVINPILYTRPTTRFIISSTPSGVAGDYFEGICTKRPDFVEFYVPASSRPDWAMVEEQVRRDFGSSQEEWDKEVLARFGIPGIGVYRDDLVRFAQEDYEYGIMKFNPSFVYTMGVDWNKEHGTEIAVVGTKRSPPHISFVVHAENIPKQEFSTPSGIHRIVALNSIWRPSWIYVDEGGGDGGSMLRHHGRGMVGKNILEARLMDIVKSYDFGAKLEIREHDGKIIKLPSKPFMVENSVKKFELGEIKYPRADLIITRQLNNYVIKRRSPAGIPVYGTKEPKWGDHRLDAINLALVAVRLEFPSFYNADISNLGAPIFYIPPQEQGKNEQRIILPAAVGGRRPKNMKMPRAGNPYTGRIQRVKGAMVSWNQEPTDEEFDRGWQRRKLFGR